MSSLPHPYTLRAILVLATLSFALMIGFYSLAFPAWPLLLLIAILAMNGAAYFYVDKIILKTLPISPARSSDCPEWFAQTAYLAEKANIPMPQLMIMQTHALNAFVIGRDQNHATIVLTTGLLNRLKKDEPAAVIAYCIVRILNHEIWLSTLVASIGMCMSLLSAKIQAYVRYALGRSFHGTPNAKIQQIILGFFSPFLALMIQLTLPRHNVFFVDEKAAELCGQSEPLMEVLTKCEHYHPRYEMPMINLYPTLAALCFVNPHHNRQWSLLFGTQPTVYDRLDRLEDYL